MDVGLAPAMMLVPSRRVPTLDTRIRFEFCSGSLPRCWCVVKPKALCEISNAASKPKRLCLGGLSFNSVRCWDFMQGKGSPCQLLSPQEPHCEKYPRRFTSVVSPERGSKISQVATPTDNDEATQTPASASRSRSESTTGLWTREGLGVRTSIGAADRLYERPSRDVTSGWSV